jgi:hypothetical protein
VLVLVLVLVHLDGEEISSVDRRHPVLRPLGFVPGRSTVTMDLVDFFPTIHFGRLVGLFEHYGAGKEAAKVTYRPKLPDGGVTWPSVLPRRRDAPSLPFGRSREVVDPERSLLPWSSRKWFHLGVPKPRRVATEVLERSLLRAHAVPRPLKRDDAQVGGILRSRVSRVLLHELRERRGGLVIVPDVKRSHRNPEVGRRIGHWRRSQRRRRRRR